MSQTRIFALIVLALTQFAVADLQVNERTSQDQKACDTALISTDSFIIVWSSYLHDGSSGAILARRLDSNGSFLGSEFQVNQTTAGNQSAPCVTCDATGNTLIAWESPGDQEDTNIWARLYDPNGQALTDEFIVNQHIQGDQSLPRAQARDDGFFIVVWESEGLPNHEKKAICMRIFDANGHAWGDEIIASDTPSYLCRYSNVAATGTGEFTVTWLEDRTSDAVKMRRFLADGTPAGPSAKVNTETFKSLTWPDCDMNASGQLVITWDGDPKKSSDDNIHARLYDPNGHPMGEQFIVNTHTPGSQRNPAVSIASNGAFLIAWDSDDPDTSTNIKARQFNPQGTPLADEYPVNTHLPDDQTNPTVVLGGPEIGHTLITWQSKAQDGSKWGIFARLAMPIDPNGP